MTSTANVLIPPYNMESNHREQKFCKLLIDWIGSMNGFNKFLHLWHIIDIATDLYFIFNLHKRHPLISYIGAVSVVFTSQALLFMWYLEVGFFKTNGREDDFDKKNEYETYLRRMKIRWGLYIFTPLEDIPMIVLTIFIILSGESSFQTILCLCASLSSLVWLKLFYLTSETLGANFAMAKKSSLSQGDVESENTVASSGNEPETDPGEITENNISLTIIVKQSERRISE